jgi:hypothetical protein
LPLTFPRADVTPTAITQMWSSAFIRAQRTAIHDKPGAASPAMFARYILDQEMVVSRNR